MAVLIVWSGAKMDREYLLLIQRFNHISNLTVQFLHSQLGHCQTFLT